MAREGLYDFASLDIEDLDDARCAANGEEWVAGGSAAGPAGAAEGFRREEEVVVEVLYYLNSSFGVWTGNDGFLAADDGEDWVYLWWGERVEVGTVVGRAGRSLYRLGGWGVS